MANLWKPLRRALLPLAAFGLFACNSEQDPTGPLGQGPAFTEINGVKLVRMLPGRTLATADGAATALVKKREGATIETTDARFVVLPGSVKNGTTISLQAVAGPNIVFKFGPNGTTFSPAAQLTIFATKADVAATDKARLRIAGASDDQENWTIVGGTYDPVTDSVTVPIYHFSRYALAVD